MEKTQLALAIAGLALSATVSTASAHTMYNTFTTTASSQTDGWIRVFDGNGDAVATGPESQGNKGNFVPWVGTAGGALPYGYAGSSHLNWAAELHSIGQTLEISRADALTRYNFAAEIDTGAGAWLDEGHSAQGAPTVVGPTGWRHQTEIGLIKSHIDADIVLRPSVVDGTGFNIQNFGITVFRGMDTNTGNYSHHGAWNCPGCNPARPFTQDNPFGTQGLSYLIHDATVDANNPLVFRAQANQIYSIYLGGAGVGRWNANLADYRLNITAVPVPGAVWLFGTALAGLIGFGRRKAAAV